MPRVEPSVLSSNESPAITRIEQHVIYKDPEREAPISDIAALLASLKHEYVSITRKHDTGSSILIQLPNNGTDTKISYQVRLEYLRYTRRLAAKLLSRSQEADRTQYISRKDQKVHLTDSPPQDTAFAFTLNDIIPLLHDLDDSINWSVTGSNNLPRELQQKLGYE